MNRKGPRQVVFVCVCLSPDNELISKVIPANSISEATKIFTETFSYAPKQVLGPFFKKRPKLLEPTVTLKFSNQTKKAIYDGWFVNAFLLEEPKNQAYLVFIKRVDAKVLPAPKGTITVPINDLRFI